MTSPSSTIRLDEILEFSAAPYATMPGVNTTKNNVFLIWGGRSWVAGHLETLLRSQGRNVHMTTVRMEDREGVQKELERVKPSHVFNCAGVTGRSVHF